MSKRIVATILSLVLCVGLLPGCQQDEVVQEPLPETPEPEVQVFEVLEAKSRSKPNPVAVGEVKAYGEYYGMPNVISEDLTGAVDLAETLTVSDVTTFSYGEPNGYDREAIIEWGKYPGLNIDVLHDLGYTGKGAVIAYVDQPICSHEQYNDANVHYVNNASNSTSMHGPTVLSMLVGKDIGTAPEAEVYFYGHSAWEADQTTHAQCLYQIIEQNKVLPEGERITMVGFSDNPDASEKNIEAFNEAIQACEDAGIMVWFCADYSSGEFLPFSDKNNPDNLVSGGIGQSVIVVPASGRTGAAGGEFGEKYIYWSKGGLSWTMPYVLGLYAIANEIDPALTQAELLATLKATCTTNANGQKVISPVGFIAEVLRGVGKNQEAQQLLDEVASRTRYLYAVMDSEKMTEEDVGAVMEYLYGITDATVIKVEAGGFSSAIELYSALKEDAKQRGGTVVGVQLFGTPTSVPTFQAKYEVQMPDTVDRGGQLLTDLFYSNFENEETLIQSYSVYEHFAQGMDVDLVPQWPVARLPLQSGEFASFMEKYSDFKETTHLAQQDIVNFSNPIFNTTEHKDNMGTFLNRAKSEFGILNVDYRLYGNLDGDAPVSNAVLGNFTAENLALENENDTVEFIINSHGQDNNIDRCIFRNGEEVRESLINSQTINQALDNNYYYLDTWTCLNGYGMQNNLTTSALRGKCVGMFSATNIISNNGVNNQASLAQMQNSNFYWFYYNYLEALNRGETRSQAFFLAQKAYAQAVLNHSQYDLQIEGNYQFNLCNLLVYHNFGLIELKYAPDKILEAPAAAAVPKNSSGAGYTVNGGSSKTAFTVYNATKELDGENYIFTVDCETSGGMGISCFNPPDGSLFMLRNITTTSGRNTYTFTVEKSKVDQSEGVTVMFHYSDDDRFFIFFS